MDLARYLANEVRNLITINLVNCKGVLDACTCWIKFQFPNTYLSYIHSCEDYKQSESSLLGQVLFCNEASSVIANVFAQVYKDGQTCLDYALLCHGLEIVADYARDFEYDVLIPYSAFNLPFENLSKFEKQIFDIFRGVNAKIYLKG